VTKTDLSSSRKTHVHSRVCLRKTLRCGFAIVLCSCLFYGAQQCRAQEAQSPDVAEAARQERARREHEATPPHVYNDDDLRRVRILTPEDEARLEAARKLQSPPLQEPAPDTLDAAAGQLPLGDIARLYRSAKQATEPAFHLPMDEPAFASPVQPVEPQPPHAPMRLAPVSPRIAPTHPATPVAPAISSSAPVHRVDPFSRRPARVAPPLPSAAPMPTLPSAAPSVKVAPPALAVKPSVPSAAPSMKAATPVAPVAAVESALRTVTVRPGDSLWKIAEENLGRGSRWREVLAANPSIANPDILEAGIKLALPVDVRAPRAGKVKVGVGDTLSKIAQTQYGRANYWRCIAQANPTVTDANRIFEGEELILPARCKP
jgi:nucleoid-associated protein YgaU